MAIMTMLGFAGCALRDASVSRPPELVGRWVRLRADGSWGDTVTYLADGGVRGSRGIVVPDSANWRVVTYRRSDALCGKPIGDCQPFRLVNDTLVVGETGRFRFYRRVR